MKEIFNRRCVRKFTEEHVSDADLEKLLRAAMQAPSAGNERPWEFVVIKDREMMNTIKDSQLYTQCINTADLLIIVCGDRDKQKFKGRDFWIQDCAAATQNLLLEAVHLGLGATWMGVYPEAERVENIKGFLGLPENVFPLCVLAVGHPDESPETVDRYLPERVHFERW